LVNVVWSCVIVLGEPLPFEVGAVVVVVEDTFDDWLVEVD
jgi:hypothetical protein